MRDVETTFRLRADNDGFQVACWFERVVLFVRLHLKWAEEGLRWFLAQEVFLVHEVNARRRFRWCISDPHTEYGRSVDFLGVSGEGDAPSVSVSTNVPRPY